MNALRTTASLQRTPERISNNSREVRLQASPSSGTDDRNGNNSSRELHHSLSYVHSSDEEDIKEVDENSLTDIMEEPDMISAPPTIRRRRKPSRDEDPSLSFIEETEYQTMNGKIVIFPTTRFKGAQLSALKTTAKCRALFAFILAILVSCAILSYYTTTEILILDKQEANAMTLSEQHVLLKAYLGDLEDGASMCNVKLPAGGNPIDLIRLLNSQTEEEEQGTIPSISSALPNSTFRMTLTLAVLCSVILLEMT